MGAWDGRLGIRDMLRRMTATDPAQRSGTEHGRAPAQGSAPARVLGTIDATCVVVGSIVGVGIFFTPTSTAALTGSGPLMLLAWGIGGLIALCGALTFAELGGMYHANGAQYQILRDAFGPLPAFLFVFCNSTAVQAGSIGIIGLVCASNMLAVVAPTGAADPSPPSLVLVLAVVLVLLVTGANILGVRWGSRVQNLTVYAKVLTLLTVTGLAAVLGRMDVLAAAEPAAARDLGPFNSVLAALVPALFAFGGWQSVLWNSGEVRDPRKNLPWAIIGGVLLVIVLYLLANWAYLKLLGVGGMAAIRTLAADAVSAVLPTIGGRLIAAAVAVSAFGVLNAQLLTGPRLVFGMARDGRFFAAFGTLNRRFGTPAAAILLMATTALVLLLTAGADGASYLLNGVVFVDTTFFVLTGAALIVLRRTAPDAERPMRVPLYPLVPCLFVLGEIGVLIGAYLDPAVARAAVVGLAWISVGALLYLAMFRKAQIL